MMKSLFAPFPQPARAVSPRGALNPTSSNPRHRSCLVFMPEHKILEPAYRCALPSHPPRRFFNVSGGVPPFPPCLTTFTRLFLARASAAAPF